MKLPLLPIAILAVIACNPSHRAAGSATDDPQRDGSSYEKAIVIKEKSESSGVSAEYKWVDAHYPGARTEKQALRDVKGIRYDVLTIRLTDGSEKDVYFDISRFFGRF